MDEHDLIPPQETSKDKALRLIGAMVSELPGGSTALAVLGLVVRPPYQRRIDEWHQGLGEVVIDLIEHRGVSVERLQEDPLFLDTVLHTTEVALRTSNEEKRQALRHAVLNAGLPGAPSEAKRQMFLNYVDRFTHWHLRLLDLFLDPPAWFATCGRQFPTFEGPRKHLLELAYEEAKSDEPFFRQVWSDLYAAGLVSTDSIGELMPASWMKRGAVSSAGAEFLRFIKDPGQQSGEPSP